MHEAHAREERSEVGVTVSGPGAVRDALSPQAVEPEPSKWQWEHPSNAQVPARTLPAASPGKVYTPAVSSRTSRSTTERICRVTVGPLRPLAQSQSRKRLRTATREAPPLRLARRIRTRGSAAGEYRIVGSAGAPVLGSERCGSEVSSVGESRGISPIALAASQLTARSSSSAWAWSASTAV